MDSVRFDINGFKEVERALDAIGSELSESVIVGSLRDAAKPMKEEMERRAPVGGESVLVKDLKTLTRIKNEKVGIWVAPGELKRRIKIKSKKAVSPKTGKVKRRSRKGEIARVRVGVFNTFYAGFIEFGTSRMQAHPFIRPAVDAKAGVVIQHYSAAIRRRIIKLQAKLARQAGKQ